MSIVAAGAEVLGQQEGFTTHYTELAVKAVITGTVGMLAASAAILLGCTKAHESAKKYCEEPEDSRR